MMRYHQESNQSSQRFAVPAKYPAINPTSSSEHAHDSRRAGTVRFRPTLSQRLRLLYRRLGIPALYLTVSTAAGLLFGYVMGGAIQ